MTTRTKEIAKLEAKLEQLKREYDACPYHEADWRYDQMCDVEDKIADLKARS